MNMFYHFAIVFFGIFVLGYLLSNSPKYTSNYIKELNQPKPCTKEVYYFQDEFGYYIPADSQQFRILFTGQVANAYFYANGKEYSTTTYYKENKHGTYLNGNCIVE